MASAYWPESLRATPNKRKYAEGGFGVRRNVSLKKGMASWGFPKKVIIAAYDKTTSGKLFVRFIALILYAEISRTMKETNLFNKMSVKELMAELKKLKQTKIKNNKTLFSELSKRQKMIFKAFNISTDAFS